jgi:pseudouridine kinase
MTQRERQLLRWIEENPMISQQELADRAGITRSSVAVHISNLMKKGYIAGKGYVLRSGTYAVVVGGANVDIGGHSHHPLIQRDSNPGQVTISVGGVGRNIAHNISLLGIDTRMLSALGDDLYGEKITTVCSAAGLDLSRVRCIKEARTSTYLYLAGPDGDMALAVNDMEICDFITPEYLAENLKLLNSAQLVVVDANIPEASIRWLAQNVTVPIFVDPVSVTKAEKLRTCLGGIHTLKPNRLEAELLSGIPIRTEEDLPRAAAALLETGLRRVFISLGADGVFAADHSEMKKIPGLPTKVQNTTGAGDAFVAGLVWAYLKGSDLEASAKAGIASSSIASEGAETINEALCEELLLQKLS